MTRFVVGEDRSQSTLFPERMDDYLRTTGFERSMSLSMSLTWRGWASAVLSRRQRKGHRRPALHVSNLSGERDLVSTTINSRKALTSAYPARFRGAASVSSSLKAFDRRRHRVRRIALRRRPGALENG